ncbi:type VII secretion protein EssC [Enterococcus faecium]|nr:type VII secretion protein EssC [Enterococcus faecium]
MEIFEKNEIKKENQIVLDNRKDSDNILFVIYLLDEQLKKVVLTKTTPFINFQKFNFGIIDDELFINGESVPLGNVEKDGHQFLILSKYNVKTTFFTHNKSEDLTIGNQAHCAIQTNSKVKLVLHEKHLIIIPNGALIYCDKERITKNCAIPIHDGIKIVTDDFQIEQLNGQWGISSFTTDFVFDYNQVLVQKQKRLYPINFPDYRRSPRLNLEVPTDKFRIDVQEKSQSSKKESLMKMILPPLGMFAMTAFTTVISGRNPIMMLGMGGMSLMTAGFTVSQYFTEKNDRVKVAKTSAETYAKYLVKTVGEINVAYQKEKAVLEFQQPSPIELANKIKKYDARIYERTCQNKDFLNVSLGLSDEPTHLKIETNVDAKDLSEEANHLRGIQDYYQTQRNVPTILELKEQTVGFVGTEEEVSTVLESILFQIAFFHSYQDVNFISLVSEKEYEKRWKSMRFLPHFHSNEFNMRGIIYSNKLRDIVLNSFYQLLNKRKQVLKESGKEVPRFTPHYIFSISDDSYLAGHGINELLAEDMSNLGVTVIWCKENEKLLPETITALIEVRNSTSGRFVTDHGTYIDKPFQPYELPTNLEVSLRKLGNLNHLEVEKNSVPESLSLLEQYEVEKVEELNITERWKEAQPNKSIRALIGWRGKSDYAYWDLHERAHGPHALVGGTTGSGKSEFLTTYLIGLAINFSPEDIGMLIIDWKGGGIANTLERLPHFMGAITNLDGAGTARALASIKAELDKRQREFAKYGVNNINGYMALYKERLTPKLEINYPTTPLPHLILVSDEFAELKANVPEFLDELTSVARIGRSLGVHLILATQKPSGVVNDQIEANSTSKIALKMANVQDSNELLKTPDAAHITNPGRGYLKVGENEVYELFQSGYAGVPYDPEKNSEEVVDERLYKINSLGQQELLYDPKVEVKQGKDTSDFPTQLEAVISEIEAIFENTNYLLPDKPWLPNLPENISTPKATQTGVRTLKVPLGLLDIPSEQAQEEYYFDLEKQNNTTIFASSGYGKSTVLQTLVLNLARVNTPEQVQFNLLDFGNNGLLPLKNLPHVADIVTLEEEEKLEKMLNRIASTLAERKKQFKEVGVASLSQYEAKTKQQLPILINLLDNYDGLSPNDKRKDTIDNLLLQVLRDGASLGIYLISTASRTGAIRMNMMSAIGTKMVLYLNEESELISIMGRDRVLQEAKVGRGQVMLEVPRAIQFYLPVTANNSSDLLEKLEAEVSNLNKNWKGIRPNPIPMVPENLTVEKWNEMIPQKEEKILYLGMNKDSAQIEEFQLFQGYGFGIFVESSKQTKLILPRILSQITSMNCEIETVLIDGTGSLVSQQDKFSIYISPEQLSNQSMDLKKSLEVVFSEENKTRIIVINGLAELKEKLVLKQEEFTRFLDESNECTQFVFLDSVDKVGSSYGGITQLIKENLYYFLFGGDLKKQRFVEGLPLEQTKSVPPRHILHQLKDENFGTIVLPMEESK